MCYELMKERCTPGTKAFRVGANHVTFCNKGQGEVVLMHDGRDKL